MHSHAPRYRATLAWLPFALVLSVVVASCILGHSVVGSADAATTVVVEGEVAAEIHIVTAGCSAASLDIGDLLPGVDPWKTAHDESGQACRIGFGTSNHHAGTTLTMLEDPGAPAAPADAMKCVGAGCAGDAIDDYQHAAAEPAAGTSAFGSQLLATGGLAGGLWNFAPAVRDVQDAADPACTINSAGDGTCDFTWGATAAAGDTPGSYQAQAQLIVIAN